MARPARSSQAFPDLDSQTLKHRRVVRLKFSPPLELAVDARRRTDPPSMAPGERNGNNNDRAFLMVGVPA